MSDRRTRTETDTRGPARRGHNERAAGAARSAPMVGVLEQEYLEDGATRGRGEGTAHQARERGTHRPRIREGHGRDGVPSCGNRPRRWR